MVKISFKGIVFLTFVICSAIIGGFTCAMTIPLLLFLRLFRTPPSLLVKLHRQVADIVGDFWYTFVGFMFEFVFGVKIYYTLEMPAEGQQAEGEKNKQQNPSKKNNNINSSADPSERRKILADFFSPPQHGKVKIIVMNHRTRMDWMLLWPFLARSSLLWTLRIVLKKSLRAFPVFGWPMQHFRFLFLSRNWDLDQKEILRVMEEYKDTSREPRGVTLLIFPEGSDLSPSNVEKSQSFAKANGLPQYRHVLNPRTTGLVAFKNFLGAEVIEELIDITVGYTDYTMHERPGEKCLLDGRTPRALHFYCKRWSWHREKFLHDISSSKNEHDGKGEGGRKTCFRIHDSSDATLKKWIEDRFMEKENKLAEFYCRNPVDFLPDDDKRNISQEGVEGTTPSHLFYFGPTTSSYSWFSVVLQEVGLFNYGFLPFFWLFLMYIILYKGVLCVAFSWVFLVVFFVGYVGACVTFSLPFFGGVDHCLVLKAITQESSNGAQQTTNMKKD